MRAWAQANGFDVDRTFLEDDTSGSIHFAKRKKGAQILALAAAGQIEHLIVPKIDRLGRSAMDVQNTIHTLRDAFNVRVHIMDLGGQHFDTGSPLSGMIISVLAWAAELEVERIRERILTKLHYKTARGELIGTVPYGWRAIETEAVNAQGKPIRRLEPNEDEQRWLFQMVQWRKEGFSYWKIAKRLNQLGVPTKRAGEVHRRHGQLLIARAGWQCGNVARLLQCKHVRRWLSNQPNERGCAEPRIG